jgi:GT2 family glycosyltransferase
MQQSVSSLLNNAADRKAHHLTVVYDLQDEYDETPPMYETVSIVLTKNGASRARNIGAGSIPRYLRQEHVLFLDDDVYMCQNWDERLMHLARWAPNAIISGYSHPFNHCEPKIGHNITERDDEGNMKTLFEVRYGEPLVISSVAMMMPWSIFDEVGPWDEPGGPGASEDFALCMRAKDKGYGFAVTDPQTVLHCGLMSSKGEQIVGYKELCEQNDKLLDFWNIRGRVIFQ